MGFSRQECWSGLPFPSPGDLPDPGIDLGLQHCRQTLYDLSHQGSPAKVRGKSRKGGHGIQGTNRESNKEKRAGTSAEQRQTELPGWQMPGERTGDMRTGQKALGSIVGEKKGRAHFLTDWNM